MSQASVRPERGADDALRLRYAPAADVYDEMLLTSGEPRPHWEAFARGLHEIGPREMARRWEQARHLIHENGVTYNIYGDPRGMDRPWELDPLPLLVAPAEWARLERGLAQRARLLNLLLADVYGPQDLIRDGLLPPALVYAHPGFLRPCHRLPVPLGVFLHLYAADLARSPDGQWWVLADRAQAPSGAGYALENRIVLSRTLPELFRDCQVARLAGFFQRLLDTLARLAPHHRDNPRIVVLTPGPYNETYFEHAYVARYLGYTLVEGGDLTVRDRAVYLKALGGLEPVDVILRRVDDGFCDPLGLRSDSSLGVPGLVEAIRAGNVTVANALGSGIVETAALMAFLPGLCRHLLGEELDLPSVATWWCGQPDALAYVEDHLDELVLKPAFPQLGMEPVFGSHLSSLQRDRLLATLRARPHAYVAQEEMTLAMAPVWVRDHVQPRHVVLRSFLVASDDDYTAMPGGLTRVAAASGSSVVSMQRGGGSKDTWVLSEGPVAPVSLLRPVGVPLELTRGGSELPSRMADNLLWLGRYAERAECTARLLRTVLARVADASPEITSLLAALASRVGADAADATIGEHGPRAAERAALAYLGDSRQSHALRATLAAAQRLAAMSRDQISLDTWRILNQLEDDLPRADGAIAVSAALDGLNRLIRSLAAFSGLGMENMTRGQGWRFADIGRRLERGRFMIGLLQSTLVDADPDEGPLLEALLEIADSAITYRRRYLGALQLAPVLDLLLTDETNPRAVVFQVRALQEHVERLPRAGEHPARSPEERVTLAALTRLRLADVTLLCAERHDRTRPHLEELLHYLAEALPALSDAITQSYLSHAARTQALEPTA